MDGGYPDVKHSWPLRWYLALLWQVLVLYLSFWVLSSRKSKASVSASNLTRPFHFLDVRWREHIKEISWSLHWHYLINSINSFHLSHVFFLFHGCMWLCFINCYTLLHQGQTKILQKVFAESSSSLKWKGHWLMMTGIYLKAEWYVHFHGAVDWELLAAAIRRQNYGHCGYWTTSTGR